MSLYAILGVPENATPEQIKKAYRKIAHETHPDRPGGDRAKFERATRAYDILMNEDTRRLYNASGAEEKPEEERTAALSELAGLFLTVIGEAESEDIILIMRRVIKRRQDKFRKDIEATRMEIRKYERIAKRIKVAQGKRNLLGDMLKAAVAKSLMSVALSEQYVRRGALMLEILADFAYEIERAEALPYRPFGVISSWPTT